MFSRRLPWEAKPNAISELRAARTAAGKPVLDLTVSNPTSAGLIYPAKAILEAFQNAEAIQYEPEAAGLATARGAVSKYYAGRGASVDPERILLTASTSEAYSLLFQLLADPGDEVLVPRPSYPLFEFLADLQSVRLRQYPLREHEGWFLDLPALEAAISPRTKAIILVNPNNPTGSYLKRDELASLVAICRARDLALICDEVFADYELTSDPHRVSSLVDVNEALTFCLSGLSKVAALPQMKLGWIVTGGPEALARDARVRLELVADTYLSVGAPVQYACSGLLEIRHELQAQIRARTQANLRALAGLPARVLPVEGGWNSILQVPRIRSEEEWTILLLRDYGVLVQPGYFYDFESEAYLVLSLLTPEDVFREGISRIAAALTDRSALA